MCDPGMGCPLRAEKRTWEMPYRHDPLFVSRPAASFCAAAGQNIRYKICYELLNSTASRIRDGRFAYRFHPDRPRLRGVRATNRRRPDISMGAWLCCNYWRGRGLLETIGLASAFRSSCSQARTSPMRSAKAGKFVQGSLAKPCRRLSTC